MADVTARRGVGAVVPVRGTGRGLTYLVAAVVLGTAWWAVLTLGALLVLVLAGGLVGASLVEWTLNVARRLADLDRRVTNRLLRVDVPPPRPVTYAANAGSRDRVLSLAATASSWRSIGWLAVRLPLALAAWTLMVCLAWFAAGLVLAPFSGALVSASPGYVVAAGIAALALVVLMLHAVAISSDAHARVAAALLGPSARDEVARMRERSAALDLRTTLARDLHDSVGHSVTASLLQAVAARRVLESDPVFVGRALEAIEEQSRGALEELDRVLGLLREGVPEVDAPVSLARLDALFAGSRTAGVALTVEQRGDLERVPPAIGHEALRIVQEGLTNILRHASGAEATVLVERAASSLVVVLENRPGTPLTVSRAGGGEGISGIAERVRALGGALEYGPLPDGGFRLRAELPVDAA